MRVTENANFDTVRESMHRTKERMDQLQLQSTTLKKVNQPSDDPIGSIKILELRTEKDNYEQFQKNAKMAESFLESTDHALADFSELVTRAKEIAINQSSSVNFGQEARLSVKEELG